MILYLVEYNGLPDFVKLSRMAFFARGKNAKPMSQRHEWLITNKQMRIKKCYIFCHLLTSNISGSRQNIKNVVDNLKGKSPSYLHAKNQLSSLKAEGAY